MKLNMGSPTYGIEVDHSMILPHNPLLSDYILLPLIINDESIVDKYSVCLQWQSRTKDSFFMSVYPLNTLLALQGSLEILKNSAAEN